MRHGPSRAAPQRAQRDRVRGDSPGARRAARLPIENEQWHRALWVYEQLSTQGGASQRSVKHPDLLIAAAAEAADVGVLHYDEDYDRIAAVTGQPTRWLAPKGTLR
jgi:hypothetical protein